MGRKNYLFFQYILLLRNLLKINVMGNNSVPIIKII